MRRMTFACLSAAMVLLAGCKTSPPREAVADCVFPENLTQKAPSWVCAPWAQDGMKDVGFGAYPKSGAGYQFSLDQATAKARVELATQMKTSVQGMIKRDASVNGMGASEVVNNVAVAAVNLITNETIAGSKVVRSTQDAKGNVYVLVGMDIETSRRQTQQVLRTSMASQPALWQQVQGSRSPEQLQADILKMGDR